MVLEECQFSGKQAVSAKLNEKCSGSFSFWKGFFWKTQQKGFSRSEYLSLIQLDLGIFIEILLPPDVQLID